MVHTKYIWVYSVLLTTRESYLVFFRQGTEPRNIRVVVPHLQNEWLDFQ